MDLSVGETWATEGVPSVAIGDHIVPFERDYAERGDLRGCSRLSEELAVDAIPVLTSPGQSTPSAS